MAWNLPSGISWLVPEPQGSACLHLPCTGITSMPPFPAFFSCALDMKLGSRCSLRTSALTTFLSRPLIFLFCFVFFRDKFSKNSRQIQGYYVALELTYVAQAGLELRMTVPWCSSVGITVVNHYAQLKTVAFLKNRSRTVNELRSNCGSLDTTPPLQAAEEEKTLDFNKIRTSMLPGQKVKRQLCFCPSLERDKQGLPSS